MTNFIYTKEIKDEQIVEPNGKYYDLIKFFISECQKHIPQSFIDERKYNKDIIKQFNLGYCNDEVYAELRQEFDLDILKESGFIAGKINKVFNNRVIFPFGDSYFSAKSTDKDINPNFRCLFLKKDVGGSKRPFYLKGTNKTLILCEGETDAIALRHIFKEENILGVGGVNSSKRYLNQLPITPESIYICFDNDESGKKYTEIISNMLLEKNLDHKIIKFDEKYKDIDEFFRHHQEKTLEFLEYKNNKKIEEMESMYVLNSKDLMNSNIPPTKYLIENLLVQKSITMVGGDSGVGKSWFALYSALKISNGLRMFQLFNTVKSSVLYIDEENDDRTIKTRLELLTKCFDKKEEIIDYKNINFAIQNDVKLDKGQFNKEIDGFMKFKYLIEKYKPDVCVIDSLVRFFQGDENSSNDIKKIYDTLKWAMKEYKTSFMILHHTTKGNNGSYVKHSLRGSGDISAQANIVLMMNKLPKSDFIKICQEKNRHDQQINSFNMLMKEIDGDFTISYGGSSEVEKETVIQDGIKVMCDLIVQNEWLEIHSNIALKQFKSKGQNETNYYRILKELEAHNLIEKLSRGKYKINDRFKDYYDKILD